jgi:UDPglucose 6-dehydrogenase
MGKLLEKTEKNPIIIIKSTVVPGTAQRLADILEKTSGKKDGKDFAVFSNPEFLREGVAVDDTINPHIIVLGGNDNKFMNKLKEFYSEFQPNVQIIKTNSQTAEIIKYANNSFLATKISFINQIASICEAIPGANIEEVSMAIGLDPRIGTQFLNAGPGYGGSCLPKDVKAIINFSSKIGVNSTLLDAVEEVNHNQVKNIISIIKNTLGNLSGHKITILGLAFKPDTDDIRESVSLKLIQTLLKEGAKITAHDPKAIDNTRSIFQNKIEYTDNISEALRDSECAVIMTSWKQYAKLDKKELGIMKKSVIIDTRRLLFDKKLDIDYHAIGIGKLQ